MNKITVKKKLTAIVLSALTAFSVGTVALTASPNLVAPTVYAAVTKTEKEIINSTKKMVFTVANDALKGICPWIGYVTEGLDILLGVSGVLDEEGSTYTPISKEDMEKLREEINAQLTEIKNEIAHSTAFLAESFNNTLLTNSFGQGIDSLHTSAYEIAGRINDIRRANISENDKLVRIAAQIGSNNEWGKNEDNFVHRISNIRAVLKGETFADLQGRDIYQILYDYYKPKSIFSSEIYDNAAPYVERALCEYFYAYSVMMECMEAAAKVAQFTDDDVQALNETQQILYHQIVSLPTEIEGAMARQTLEMFDIHNANSLISRYTQFLYNTEFSRYTYINKGNTMKAVKQEIGTYLPDRIADNGEVKVKGKYDGSAPDEKSGPQIAYDNATTTLQNTLDNLPTVSLDSIGGMGAFVQENYPDIKTVWNYLSDRGFTYEASADTNTNILVASASVKEWGEEPKHKGYNGYIYNTESLSPEDTSLYTLTHRSERDPYAGTSVITYSHYYKAFTPDAIKAKPVKLFYLATDTLKNNTRFYFEETQSEDGKTDRSLHIDCMSSGSTGPQNWTIKYRKTGETDWNYIYVPRAEFDAIEYADYEFMTVITDKAGNTSESILYNFNTYCPEQRPYINADGEYIEGNIEHYAANGKNYAVNPDGSAGEELSDISISDFEFRLLEDDTYMITYYTGSYDSLEKSELVIPKSYKGKNITIVGDGEHVFMSKTTGTEKEFFLVLNENISLISTNAFADTQVVSVYGDTSGLKKIGGDAFARVNKYGGRFLSIKLDYEGHVKTPYAFVGITLSATLKHATTFDDKSELIWRVYYTFSDEHYYDTSRITWNWGSNYKTASATVTCIDERCNHTEDIPATITKVINGKETVYTATAVINGQTFTNSVTADTVFANISTVSSKKIAKGTALTVNCAAEGGSDDILYSVFYKKASSSKWTTVQSSSKNATVTIKPAVATDYQVRVKAIDNASPADNRVSAIKTFTVKVYNAMENTSTISDETINKGDSVTVNCSSKGGVGTTLYTVSVKKAASNKWSVAKSKTTKSEVVVTPAAAGQYNIRVEAVDKGVAVADRVPSVKEFTVNVAAPLKNTSSLSRNIIVKGGTITVNCASTGGAGKKVYSVFFKKANSDKWSLVQASSENTAVEITPASVAAYVIRVKATDEKGVVDSKELALTVNGPLTNNSVISSDTIKLGKTVQVNAIAVGGVGEYAYHIAYKKQISNTWSRIDNLIADAAVEIKPVAATTYDIRVEITDADETSVIKYFTVTVKK